MNKCISLSDEILEKVRKEVQKQLNTKGLTTLDIESAIQSALNKEEGLTIEVLLDQKMQLINDAITQAKNNKIREKQLTEKESINSNILGIPLSVSTKKVDSSFKLNVSKNEDTLYIYPDSAQARTLNGETTTIKEGIVELDKNNQKEVLTAKNQWAAARNDINGDKNKNSAGIVVRRNSRVPKGQDTNSFVAEDEKSFEQEVLSNIQEIKENIKDEKYKKVVIPEEFSGALPENLAKKLAELLYKELGITTQVILENAHKNLYKVKVNKPVQKNTKQSLKQTEIN